MSGAKKGGKGWLWAGAGCFAVVATLFTVAWMAVIFGVIMEFSDDGYAPPDFIPAVYTGDGLVSFEEETVLSDVEPQDGELRAFQGKLYAMLDDWAYVYDPASDEVRFDPVEEWYTYLAPYGAADGSEAMGYAIMGYTADREVAFYDASWEERWRFAPEQRTDGMSAWLDNVAAGDLRGDGVRATVLSIGYFEDGDYEMATPTAIVGSALKNVFGGGDSGSEFVVAAIDPSGAVMWTADLGSVYGIACANVDGEPGDEVVVTGATEFMVYDGATGAAETTLPIDATMVFDTAIVNWPGDSESLLAVGDGIEVFDFAAGATVRNLPYEIAGTFVFVGAAAARLHPGAAPHLAVLQSGYNEDYDPVARLRIHRNDGELIYDAAIERPFIGIAALPQDDGTDTLYLLEGASLIRVRIIADAH